MYDEVGLVQEGDRGDRVAPLLRERLDDLPKARVRSNLEVDLVPVGLSDSDVEYSTRCRQLNERRYRVEI